METSLRQIDRYLLYPSFAAGGMATIHLGRQTGALGVGRVVAIKRLQESLARDPHFRDMFLDEARIASGIDHPNVVRTLDVISTDSELMIVMELVRGDAFSRLLAACRDTGVPAPLPVVSAIVSGALDGLHAAHEATDEAGRPLEIVHRDVSPHNILVGTDGVARIADFGIARAFGRSAVTRTGEIKGKLCYMPPEQMRSDDVDRRADIYAMAVILWEALTGKRLYEGPDPSILFAVLEETPEPPSSVRADLPEGLDALVMRGLSKNRTDRFETALEMARALEALVPPARPRDVGEWVLERARENLERQASMVSRIEAGVTVTTGVGQTDSTITGTISSLTSPAIPMRRSPVFWGIAGVGAFTATLAIGALAHRSTVSSSGEPTPTIPLPTARPSTSPRSEADAAAASTIQVVPVGSASAAQAKADHESKGPASPSPPTSARVPPRGGSTAGSRATTTGPAGDVPAYPYEF